MLARQVEFTMFFPFLFVSARLGPGPGSSGGACALALLALAPLLVQVDGERSVSAQDATAPAPKTAPFRFEPGAKVPALLIPRDEELVYCADLHFALGETNVGKVKQTCTVEELKAPLIATAPVAQGEAACILLEAEASLLWMDMRSELKATILPQEWPRLLYTTENTSSQTRRRELWIGHVDDKPRSKFRGDTSKGAEKGTRIWKLPKERDVPEGALDMISAVFMTRALMREEKKSLTFPLVDKDRVWKLTLKRGEEKRMEVPAGTFDVVKVVLEPEPWPDEPIDKEKLEQFEGVFGIQGTIHLWVEKKTGIAVRIQGNIPIKLGMSADVDVQLESFRGTPEDFAPLAGAADEED